MIFSLRFASMFLASKNKPDPLPKTLPFTGRASLSPPVARSLGLDVSIKSSAGERTDIKREEQHWK
jgi:hypothetical protein